MLQTLKGLFENASADWLFVPKSFASRCEGVTALYDVWALGWPREVENLLLCAHGGRGRLQRGTLSYAPNQLYSLYDERRTPSPWE